VFFDNETEAYRFASLLLEVKRNGQMKLKQVPKNIPISTAKRYLDYAVEIGMLKHEDNMYMLTDRFTKPLRNIATYIKAWMDSTAEEDIGVEFANARTDKQEKRGGRASANDPEGHEGGENESQRAGQ
jgi:predicted transcriptional regulator